MSEVVLVLGVLVAYGVGSVPSGFFVARRAGVGDIRQHGSGNIGATNVLRTLGWRSAVVVLLIDAFKGAFGVLLLRFLGGSPEWQALGGIAAMAGHVWPFMLGFRGGRGVATGMGVLTAVEPLAGLVALVGFVLIVVTTRYVSLGSIIAGIPALITVWLRGASLLEVAILAVGNAIIIWRHSANIGRLRNGTESRFSLRRKAKNQPAVTPAPESP